MSVGQCDVSAKFSHPGSNHKFSGSQLGRNFMSSRWEFPLYS